MNTQDYEYPEDYNKFIDCYEYVSNFYLLRTKLNFCVDQEFQSLFSQGFPEESELAAYFRGCIFKNYNDNKKTILILFIIYKGASANFALSIIDEYKIQADKRIYYPGGCGYTRAQIVASAIGNAELIACLFKKGVLPEELGLRVATWNGHGEIVQQYLQSTIPVFPAGSKKFMDSERNTPVAIQIAAERGHPHLLKIFFDCGFLPTQRHILAVINSGNEQSMEIILEERQGDRIPILDQFFDEAVEGNHENIVVLLLQNGANINRQIRWPLSTDTALITASKNGKENLVKVLLEAGAGPQIDYIGQDGSALIQACKNGHVGVVSQLLQNGANIEGNCEGNFKLNFTALFIACLHGNFEVVNVLLSAGASVKNTLKEEAFGFASGTTVFEVTSACGHFHVLNLLLKNTPATLIDEQLWLIRASSKGLLVLVRKFLKAGASVDFQALVPIFIEGVSHPIGTHALIAASIKGHAAVVKELLMSQASVNLTNSSGNNALMYAAMGGYKDVITDLLDAGSSIDQENNEGISSAILASQNGHHTIAHFLLQVESQGLKSTSFSPPTHCTKTNDLESRSLPALFSKERRVVTIADEIQLTHNKILSHFSNLIDMFVSQKLKAEMETIILVLKDEYQMVINGILEKQRALLEEIQVRQTCERKLCSQLEMTNQEKERMQLEHSEEKIALERKAKSQIEELALKSKKEVAAVQHELEEVRATLSEQLRSLKEHLERTIVEMELKHEEELKSFQEQNQKLEEEVQKHALTSEEEKVEVLHSALNQNDKMVRLGEEALFRIEKKLESLLVNVRRGKEQCIRLQSNVCPEEVSFCCVCLERPRSVLMVPCNHLCLCEFCSTDAIRQCPICRNDLENRLRIFS